MALPLALLMVLVLTIAVFGVIDYSATGTRNASLAESRQEAKSIAEGAFNSAVSIVAAAADPATATLPDCTTWSAWTTVAPGEETRWCGTYDSLAETWTVKGQGRVTNPTGRSTSAPTSTVQAQLELVEDNGAWNFVWVRSAPDRCMTIKNSFGFTAPLYVVGCLELLNDARYDGPRLYVTGSIASMNELAGVGSAASRVPHVSVRDIGCKHGGGDFHLPCGDADHVWTDAFDREVPDIPKPPADFPARYADAAPGSAARGHSCTSPNLNNVNSKLTATKMDDNSVLDKSLGVVNIMPPVAYDCTQRAADGTVLGRIQWSGAPVDPADGIRKGTLTITGTIYLDGELGTSNTTRGVVNGTGIIYASSKFTLQGNAWLCGTADCGPSWDPNMNPPHLLFVYAGGFDPTAISIEIKSDAKFQGGLYAAGALKVSNNGFVHGPAVAEQTDTENGADFNPWPWFVDLPAGVESGMGATLRVKPGSWRG